WQGPRPYCIAPSAELPEFIRRREGCPNEPGAEQTQFSKPYENRNEETPRSRILIAETATSHGAGSRSSKNEYWKVHHCQCSAPYGELFPYPSSDWTLARVDQLSLCTRGNHRRSKQSRLRSSLRAYWPWYIASRFLHLCP